MIAGTMCSITTTPSSRFVSLFLVVAVVVSVVTVLIPLSPSMSPSSGFFVSGYIDDSMMRRFETKPWTPSSTNLNGPPKVMPTPQDARKQQQTQQQQQNTDNAFSRRRRDRQQQQQEQPQQQQKRVGISPGNVWDNENNKSKNRNHHQVHASMPISSKEQILKVEYNAWADRYGKIKSEERYKIWSDNMILQMEYNKRSGDFFLLNEYGDMTTDEYNRKMKMRTIKTLEDRRHVQTKTQAESQWTSWSNQQTKQREQATNQPKQQQRPERDISSSAKSAAMNYYSGKINASITSNGNVYAKQQTVASTTPKKQQASTAKTQTTAKEPIIPVVGSSSQEFESKSIITDKTEFNDKSVENDDNGTTEEPILNIKEVVFDDDAFQHSNSNKQGSDSPTMMATTSTSPSSIMDGVDAMNFFEERFDDGEDDEDIFGEDGFHPKEMYRNNLNENGDTTTKETANRKKNEPTKFKKTFITATSKPFSIGACISAVMAAATKAQRK